MFRAASTSLGPTSTLTTGSTDEEPELAPFEESDIAPILEILSKCPDEGMLTRVFRQHSAFGTCWYDSALMMIFESSIGKQIFLPLLKQCFIIFLKNGIKDLSYSHRINLTPEEFEMEKKYNKNAKPYFINTSFKTELIGTELKRFTGSSVDNITREVLAHSLHKYLLLGYLFLKKPPKGNAKLLSERRKSWNAGQFEDIHRCLRTVSGMFTKGAQNKETEAFIKRLSSILENLSRGECAIIDWNTNKPEETHGYYLIVGDDKNSEGHVISMFKCNERWTLFNNDYGIVPLSKEESEQVSKIGIESIAIYTDIKENLLSHDLVLNDKTKIVLQSPYVDGEKNINFHFFKSHVSYAFVSRKPAGAAGEGGKRKKRKTSKKTRKQKRKTYKK
jgi:hypothetical protein